MMEWKTAFSGSSLCFDEYNRSGVRRTKVVKHGASAHIGPVYVA